MDGEHVWISIHDSTTTPPASAMRAASIGAVSPSAFFRSAITAARLATAASTIRPWMIQRDASWMRASVRSRSGEAIPTASAVNNPTEGGGLRHPPALLQRTNQCSARKRADQQPETRVDFSDAGVKAGEQHGTQHPHSLS